MKLITYLCAALLLPLPGCTSQSTPPVTAAGGTSPRLLTLLYDQPIAGYTVRVQWLPTEVRLGFLQGPAILTFQRDSSTFSLASNHFRMSKSLVAASYSDADSTEFQRLQSDTLHLTYRPAANVAAEPFDADAPFLFADINFDQRPELLLQEAAQGQRGVPVIKAYEFDDGLNAPAPTLLTGRPFDVLDGLSTLDRTARTLTIENSSGACSSSEDIYRLLPATAESETAGFALVEIFDHDYDERFCYEFHYKVNPKTGQKTLLSKKAFAK